MKHILIAVALTVLTVTGCGNAGSGTPGSNGIQKAQDMATQGVNNTAANNAVTNSTPLINPDANKTGASNSTAPVSNLAQSRTTSSRLPALNAVDFANKQVGWVGGNHIILSTIDKGLHWTQQYSGNTDVIQIDAVDSTHAYAIGKSGTLLYTSDGGLRWINSRTNQKLQYLDFTNSHSGWGISNGMLVRTADGGQVWNVVRNVGLPSVRSITFVSNLIGYATGSSDVVKTTDGGQTWHRVFAAPVSKRVSWTPTIEAKGDSVWVQLVGDDAGMMKQAYVIFHSLNGGVSWKGVLADTAFAPDYPTVKNVPWVDAYPGPFDVVNSSTAYFFGICPACFYGTSSFKVTVNNGQSFSGRGVSGVMSPTHIAMTFTDAAHGWFVWNNAENQGEILATSDSGKSWIVQAPANAGPIPVTTGQQKIRRETATANLKVVGLAVGTVAWQDGLVKTNNGPIPFYVWTQPGQSSPSGSTPSYIQTGTTDQTASDVMRVYWCPRDIGSLSITGFSENGKIVRMSSSKGVHASFNLANHAWTFS